MEEVVSRVHTYCDFNTRVFALNWDPNRATLIKNLSLRLRDGIIKSREAEEEMRTVRAQLKEIADRIADQERAWTAWAPPAGAEGPAGPNTPAILNRFKGRFKEIDNEIDGLMSQCRTTAEAQQYTSDLIVSEISRLEARASRRQGMQSKFLAMIATIFLPMTSVATIFAVPAFKFENDWLDIRFRPANASESRDGSSSSPSDPPNPVFSGYGIIFIVISVCLSCFTYYAYLSATKRLEENDELLINPLQQPSSTAADERPGTTVGWQGKEGSGSSSNASSPARLGALGAGFRFLMAAPETFKSWKARRWFPGRGEQRQKIKNPGDSPV